MTKLARFVPAYKARTPTKKATIKPQWKEPAGAPTLSDLRAINVGATSTQWSIDYTFS